MASNAVARSENPAYEIACIACATAPHRRRTVLARRPCSRVWNINVSSFYTVITAFVFFYFQSTISTGRFSKIQILKKEMYKNIFIKIFKIIFKII